MRILIVDDDYVSRIKLKELMAKYGDCDAAGDGELAIKMVESAFREGIPYKLITMDIEMPGMSGQEALNKIRQLEKSSKILPNKEAKILMVTGKEDIKNVSKSYGGGCDGYCTKPFTDKSIEKTLKEIGVIT